MKNSKLEHISLLLTPSPTSLVLSLVLAAFSVGAAFLANGAANGGDLSGGLQVINGFSAESLDNLKQTLAKNEIVGGLPLILFWAAIGLVVYSSATHLFAIFSNAEKLREEMDFIHASRNEMLADAFRKVVLRLSAIGVWLIYIQVSVKTLAPYVAACLQIAVASDVVRAAGYSALAALVIVAGVHLHVVLIRLIMLRYRLFSSNT